MNIRLLRRLVCTAIALVCGAELGFSQQASAPPNEADLLNVAIDRRCAHDAQIEKVPVAYLVALHPDSIRDEAPPSQDVAAKTSTSAGTSTLRANVVIYISADGALMPLLLGRYPAGNYGYLLNCERGTGPGHFSYYPGLRIKLDSAEQKSEFLARLMAKASSYAAGATQPPLLFYGNRPDAALIPWPTSAQPPNYGALLSAYLKSHREITLLDSATGDVSLETLEQAEPNNKALLFKKIAPRTRTAGEEGKEEVIVTTPDAGALLGGPPEQKTKRKVQVRLANKSLAALDLAEPRMVDTFGYCARVERQGSTPGLFALIECLSDDRGQIPIRIRGFEPTSIEARNQVVTLDPLLNVRPYSVPYPPQWQTGASDRVEVPGGTIEAVMNRRIALRQFALAACEASTKPSVTDVLAGTLTFPEPPCGTIDLILPKELFGKTAPTAERCRPGTAARASAAKDGRIRCVATAAEMKAGTKQVVLTWAPGFDPFELPLPAKRGSSVPLPAADVLNSIHATLPRQIGLHNEAETPSYQVREVQYFAGTQACGKPSPLVEARAVPTLAAAGCKALPDRLRLTFEIDRTKSNPSVPSDAFKDTIMQDAAIGTLTAALQFDASTVRRDLAIDFNQERQQRYTEQYTKPAELVVPGAKIYVSPGCSDKDSSAKVSLFTKREKSTYHWPVYGQVFDNEGRPLTDCARSIVDRAQDGTPYLTFEFTSTRAAGPRRSIILVRSQDLMDKRGLPKALETAFARFVEMAHEWHKQGAPLSPVDVLSVSQDGAMRRVFSAEEAALHPKDVTQSIAEMDRTAPKTPDFSLFRLQPETKSAERVMIIMDGSNATARHVAELRLLGSDLGARKGGSLQFFLSSDSCALWLPHAPQLRCVDVGSLRQSDREKVLIEAFTGFLNPVRTR